MKSFMRHPQPLTAGRDHVRPVFGSLRRAAISRRIAAVLAFVLPLQQMAIASGAPAGPAGDSRLPLSMAPTGFGGLGGALRGAVLEDSSAPANVQVVPGHEAVLTYGGASIRIPAGAVDEPVRVTIRPLSVAELPLLPAGMHNVTPGLSGYRFGPHGMQFRKPVEITLPVDVAALRGGFRPSDVNGYFYDENDARWKAVPTGSRPRSGTEIVSLTTHFTDFISATLTAPEHPTAASFDENTMKGVKVGNPAAGVTLIEPPVANWKGSAALTYPIEVPPGRNGLQPELALRYDSDDTRNGFYGIGWDLPLSHIECDTRFGVPRYDGVTPESYLLDGEALTRTGYPPAGVPDPGAGMLFARRVEGRFDRIARHGGNPAEYWWEVTDKRGTRYIYGLSAQARLEAYHLAARPGIFRWYLEKVEDTFGNQILYTYYKDTGGGPGSEPFVQVYPQRIDYTGHKTVPGSAPYHVYFDRTQAERADRMVTARPGFQVKTRYLIDKIRVVYGTPPTDQPIRSYQLHYEPGDFEKNRLDWVEQKGREGGVLGRHDFEYFNKARRDEHRPIFAPPVVWGAPFRSDQGISQEGHEGGGGGVSVGAGFAGFSISSGVVGFGTSRNDELSFLDLNGDGIDDFVGHDTVSRGVLQSPAPGGYQAALQVAGLAGPALGDTYSSGVSASMSGVIGPITGNFTGTFTWLKDQEGLADLDGDGFVDLVQVKYDKLYWRKNLGPPGMQFGAFEAYGQTPLRGADQPLSPPAWAEPTVQSGYLTGPLVIWVAPRPGRVVLRGHVQKMEPGGDGLTLELFRNADPAPVWQRPIAAPDTAACSMGQGLGGCGGVPLIFDVVRGERFYFLTRPNQDDQADFLQFAPEFDYAEIGQADYDAKEPWGARVHQFRLVEDFRIAGAPAMPWVAPADGKVRFTSAVVKTRSADRIVLRVARYPVGQQEAPWGGDTLSATDPPLGENLTGQLAFDWTAVDDIEVKAGDQIRFEVQSDSPIDPATIDWRPRVRYTSYCRPARVRNSELNPVCRPVTCVPGQPCRLVNDNIDIPADVIERGAVPYVPVVSLLPDGPTQVGNAGNGFVTASIVKTDFSAGPITVLLQGANRLYYKHTFAWNDVNLNAPLNINVAVEPGDVIATVLADTDPTGKITWTPHNGQAPIPVNIRYRDHSLDNFFAGGGFHGWYFGDWRADQPFAPAAIEPPPPPDRQLQPGARYNFLTPVPASIPWKMSDGTLLHIARWVGRGPSLIVADGGYLHASTVALAHIRNQQRNTDTGPAAGDLWLRHASVTTFNGAGGVVGFGAGVHLGETDTDADFFDMNGDRRPDSVYNDGFRLNNGAGLDAKQPFAQRQLQLDPNLRAVHTRGTSANASNGMGVTVVSDASGSGQISVQMNGGLGISESYNAAHIEMIDINGDGLLDHVKRKPVAADSHDPAPFTVELNLGYGFSLPTEWPAPKWRIDDPTDSDPPYAAADFHDVTSANVVRFEQAIDDSTGAGLGVGGADVSTSSRTLVDLMDVNGDGLPDAVMRTPHHHGQSDDKLHVMLNMGDHFADEEDWDFPEWRRDNEVVDTKDTPRFIHKDFDALSARWTEAQTVSVDVQVCWFVCIGVKGYYNGGEGKTRLAFHDIDGDGRVDQVMQAAGAGGPLVKRNRTDESNLLRKVRRPLGGEIELGYKRDGNRVISTVNRTADMPGNQWVLSTVTTRDGQGNQYDAWITYGDGRYDRIERESYGYDWVKTTRADGSSIEERHHNHDYYLRGRVHQRLVRDAQGNVVSESRTRWVREQTTAPFLDSWFPQDLEEDDYFYTAGSASYDKQHHRERTYEKTHGNLLTLEDDGDDGAQDDLVYTILYHEAIDPGVSGSYIIRPARITARNGIALVAERQATYSAVTGALLTLTSTLVGGRDPQTGALRLGQDNPTATFSYDAYGNLVLYEAPGQSFTYGYDQATRTHRTSIEDNHFHYVSTATPNLLFGAPEEIVDINGQKQTFRYDQHGRPIYVWGPGSNVAETGDADIVFAYGASPSGPQLSPVAWAKTSHKDIQHGADPIDTVVFIDGLGRELATKKDFDRDPGGNQAPVPGYLVSGPVAFDALGRVTERAEGYFVAGAAGPITAYNPAPPRENITRIVYDALSRVVEQTTPDNKTTRTSYAFEVLNGINRFTTTVTDPLNRTRASYGTVRGETVAVSERNHIGNVLTTLTTHYQHDALGRLVDVEDAKGNHTTAVWDTLGQLVVLTSPDAGRTEYRYDLAGHLAAKETAVHRGAQTLTRYHYTHGRLDGIDYPDVGDVSYTYGPPGAPHYGAGRVTSVTDESGTEKLRYGRLGDVVERERTLHSVRNNQDVGGPRYCDQLCGYDDKGPVAPGHSCAGAATYTTKYTHDAFGRLLSLEFPDGETLHYQYDGGGNVQRVSSSNGQVPVGCAFGPGHVYVDHIGYDERGQRRRIRYGNGAETVYAYDGVMRRLHTVTTRTGAVEPAPQGHPLQQLTYTYNAVGNITRRQNLVDPAHMDGVDVGSSDVTYRYDLLDQLVEANATYLTSPDEGHTAKTELWYDEIGNTTKKVQWDVPYDAGGTLAATASTSRAFTYDYAGAGPHQVTRLSWLDPQPGPIDNARGGQRRDVVYDANGNQAAMATWPKPVGGQQGPATGVRALSWDTENRLTIVQQASNDSELEITGQVYTYDAAGERTHKRMSLGSCPEETKYVSEHLVVKDDALFSKHIYVGSQRIATAVADDDVHACLEPQAIFYYHSDHLQSTQFVTNAAGHVVENVEYFPSGEPWIHNRPVQEQKGRPVYLFTGKEQDDKTELSYFGARYYDAKVGGWLSADPILDRYIRAPKGGAYQPRQLGLYTYTWNSPIRLQDPDGRQVVGGEQQLRNEVMMGQVRPGADEVRQGMAEIRPVVDAVGGATFLGGATGVFAGQTVTGAKLSDEERALSVLGMGGGSFAGIAGGVLGRLGRALRLDKLKGWWTTKKAIKAIDTADGATNVANGPRLAAQLKLEEASSVFVNGGLHADVVAGAQVAIPGAQFKNQELIKTLTSNGGSIEDWAKMTTSTINGPSGPFQVHFYKNLKTGDLYYGHDFKAVFNHGGAWP